MFKVGDKVRILTNEYDFMIVGSIGTVTAGPTCEGNNTYMVATDVTMDEHEFSDDGQDFHACFYDYELELVQ
jgi:hypothetical protein